MLSLPNSSPLILRDEAGLIGDWILVGYVSCICIPSSDRSIVNFVKLRKFLNLLKYDGCMLSFICKSKYDIEVV